MVGRVHLRHAAQCVHGLLPHTLTRRACSSDRATHARHADVVQHVLAVEVEALGDLYDALGAEGALGVENQRTAFATCERGSLGVLSSVECGSPTSEWL